MGKKILIVILNDDGELEGRAKDHVQRMIAEAVAEAKTELSSQIEGKLDAAVFAQYMATGHNR